MRIFRVILVLWSALSCVAWAGANQNTSHIGYAYPAGGQAGQTVDVLLGGRVLKGTDQILFSGQGLSAQVLQHIPSAKRRLQEHLKFLKRERFGKGQKGSQKRRFGEVPNHPYFSDWTQLSDADFRVMAKKFDQKERIQRNNELNELLAIRVTIAADATLGLHELYVKSSLGVSNPVRFMVNQLPEILEREPNDQGKLARSLTLPFVANGQIQPGDIDRFTFQASKGQKLVVQIQARELIPYLADAVPGWFQAVVRLTDAKGKEVAFADDYRFNPDPVLYFAVPQSAEYTLAIRDSVFRGRDDFVYRIRVGELPFVTQIYPLGGRVQHESIVSLQGWNLPFDKVALNTAITQQPIVSGVLRQADWLSNEIRYALGVDPEVFESNSHNNSFKHAQSLSYPVVVNGKIEQVEDVDVYKFYAEKGQTISAQVLARQLNSPMDPILRLFAANGELLAWRDDNESPQHIGLMTHDADPSLTYAISDSGDYFLQVADSQYQGGSEFSYRLQLTPARPDFDLYVSPSAISLRPGGTGVITLHAVRHNGFDGPIAITLRENSAKVRLTGGEIPSGESSIRAVLSVPFKTKKQAHSLAFQGEAQSNEQRLVRVATPANAYTQAFIIQHVVPVSELKFMVDGRGNSLASARLSPQTRLQLAAHQVTTIHAKVKLPKVSQLSFELQQAPKGVQLSYERTDEGYLFKLVADESAKQGLQGNLIIQVLSQRETKHQKIAKPQFIGVLPAVPFSII